MRILYFSRDYTPHDYRFLSALAKSPHQVAYLRLEKRGQALEDRALPPEIEQLTWSGGHAPARLQDGARLLRELKGIIRQTRPDLIQAGPLQRSAFLAALAGFHPLVSMSWGYDLIQDAGRNRWWRWATRYTLKHSDAMLGDCAAIRRLAVEYGMPDERIITFPWGIDLQQFCPLAGIPATSIPATSSLERAGDNARPFTLLSTRGWEPIYGVDVIAQAFVQAARLRPEMRLIMLGSGSQAPHLRRIFSQEGVQEASEASLHGERALPQVIFPGQVRQADLPGYYRRADLYIAATHSDGTSISLLEAMACGKPAVVSDIFGNREWVTPEETGWLFPAGDATALAQHIVQAFDQRQRLVEMGCAARQIAEQRADWNKNFPRLFEVYEIALRGRKQPAPGRERLS